ncbi:MAG: M48 family metallopeptidase [Phycisphaerales bacterium]
MTQILLIMLAAAQLARDQFTTLPLYQALGPAWAGVITLSVHGVIATLSGGSAIIAGRRLARTGDPSWFVAAGAVQSGAQWASVIWHIVAVLVFGWLDVVRAYLGDWIGVDEAVAMVPPLLVFVAGWWGMAPIDLLIRQSRIMRSLDEGQVVYPPPSTAQFVLLQARTHLAMMCAPMVVLMAWSEVVAWAIAYLQSRVRGPQMLKDSRIDRFAAWMHDAGAAEGLRTGAQVVGLLVVFCLMPLVLRRLWDTIALPPQGLRERLLDLCAAHGVRVRNVLVWRTHGSLANGVVIGIVGPLRYILLSDALLDGLEDEEVMAVMAHEVGHVRRRHMLWLGAALVACTGGCSLMLTMLGRVALDSLAPAWTAGWSNGRGPMTLAEGVAEGVLSLAGLGLGLVAFGWVARRFEWQADAFAAQHLSGLRTRQRESAHASGLLVSEGAVLAIVGALNAVARLNGIERRRFSWLHGSIARRVENLWRVVDLPARDLPIDGVVRRVKWACAAVVAGLVAAAVWL